MTAQKLKQSVTKRLLEHRRVRRAVERHKRTLWRDPAREYERMDVRMNIEEGAYAVKANSPLPYPR